MSICFLNRLSRADFAGLTGIIACCTAALVLIRAPQTRAQDSPAPVVQPDVKDLSEFGPLIPPPPSFEGKAFIRAEDGSLIPIEHPIEPPGAPERREEPDNPRDLNPALDIFVGLGSETSLAVDRGNSNNAIGAWNLRCPSTPSMASINYLTRTTAARSFPHGSGTATSSPYDPWCNTGNAAGTLFVTLIDRDPANPPQSRCVISRSTNGGAGFSRFYEAANRAVFQDREMVDIDRTTALGGGNGNTHDGKIYLCFDDFGATGANYNESVIQIISSAGALLTERVISTSAGFNGSQVQPVAGINDGQVYLMALSLGGGGTNTVLSFHEMTGAGASITWNKSSLSYASAGQNLGGARWGLNGHRTGFPRFMDIDRTNGARRGALYIVGERNPNPGNVALDQGDIVYARSNDGAVTWTAVTSIPTLQANRTQYFPMMDVDDNGWVHVGYYQNQTGATNNGVLNAATADVFHVYSTDGGTTWSAPRRFNDLPANTLNYEDPPLNHAGAAFYLVGDYQAIQAVGLGVTTQVRFFWTTYNRNRPLNCTAGSETAKEWVVATALNPRCATCVGDVNGDNSVNGLDILGFTQCLTSGGTSSPDCHCADMNADGAVDFVDSGLFVARLLLVNPGC